MSEKLVLYQYWPTRHYKHYQIAERTMPTTTMDSFPLTKAGLEKAIEHAERSDAQVVRLKKEYFTSESFMAAVQKKVDKGKGIKIFQPVKHAEVIDA